MVLASIAALAPDYSGMAYFRLMVLGVFPITIMLNIFAGMAMGFVTKAGGGTSLFAGTFAGIVGSVGTIALTLWLWDTIHFELTVTVVVLMLCSTFPITALLSWTTMMATMKMGNLWTSSKTTNS